MNIFLQRAGRDKAAWLATAVLAVFLFLPRPAAGQADYAREQRWADEITPGIVVGDAVQLELKSGRKFLAIYTASPKAAAGVILVHGRGAHPDARVVTTLRSQLAEQGYATLSVQMPVLDAEAPSDKYPPLFPEASERMAAAAAFLRGKGMKKIALVAHSLGARMANDFVIGGEARVDAWVAIGILGEYVEPGKFKAPVLDLYGEHDFPAVMDSAARRGAALAKVRGSGQVQVGGADHLFSGRETELVKQVRLFLDARLR
jgi:pimeloyl-ACP methyl ester carboxylesterase